MCVCVCVCVCICVCVCVCVCVCICVCVRVCVCVCEPHETAAQRPLTATVFVTQCGSSLSLQRHPCNFLQNTRMAFFCGLSMELSPHCRGVAAPCYTCQEKWSCSLKLTIEFTTKTQRIEGKNGQRREMPLEIPRCTCGRWWRVCGGCWN